MWPSTQTPSLELGMVPPGRVATYRPKSLTPTTPVHRQVASTVSSYVRTDPLGTFTSLRRRSERGGASSKRDPSSLSARGVIRGEPNKI